MRKDRLLMQEPPDRLEVEVRATGFEVLWYWLRPIRPVLTVDLGKAKLRPVTHEGNAMQYMLTSSQRDRAGDVLSPSIKVLHLSPDTFYFHFVQRTSKKLPVRIAGEITYGKKTAPNGNPLISPSHVTVYGPHKLLSEMKHVETLPVSWTDVSESISTKVQLQPLAEPRLLTMDVEEVEVQLDVNQVESRDFKVRVEIPDKAAYRKWTVWPEEVVVTVKATAERLEKIVEADIACTVDARTAKKDDRLKVNFIKKPQGVVDIRCRPEDVRIKAR